MRWTVLAALLASLAGCGGTTDPSTVSLTGQWRGSVGSLGIQFVTLDLTDADRQLSGSGTWTGQLAPAGSGTLTANGLHFGTNVQLNLTFETTTGPQHLSLTGQIVDANSFYLLFPTDPTPSKITFTR